MLAASNYADIAQQLIDDCPTFDFDALRVDAFLTLSESTEVILSVEDNLVRGCGGGGYYRPIPPTIYLHPSILRRDNFTLLHELGHHLQCHHPEWSYVLLDLSKRHRLRVEELVSDAFAGRVLIPRGIGRLGSHDDHPADVMAGLYESTSASRSAVLMRVREMLPAPAKWILAVADLEGCVQSATATYDQPCPARGSVQEGFAALAAEAQNGPRRRPFHEGVTYRTGSVLTEMRAEAVLDQEGRYAFIALTPAARFGMGRIIRPHYECTNTSCGATFGSAAAGPACTICGNPRCPECNQCGCDPTDTGQTCDKCFTRLTPGEVANGHECW